MGGFRVYISVYIAGVWRSDLAGTLQFGLHYSALLPGAWVGEPLYVGRLPVPFLVARARNEESLKARKNRDWGN